MFSNKFDKIINKHPEQAAALSRVADYFVKAEHQSRKIEKLKLDIQRLMDIADVKSPASLAGIVSLLLTEHVLKRVVVVESPIGGGIAEYASFAEVPERIHDTRQDLEIKVRPENLRTYYLPDLRE